MSPVDIREALGELRALAVEHRTDVRCIREAQVEQGQEIAALRATCAAREGRCGARFEGIGKRIAHISEEMGGVREVSQVARVKRVAWRQIATSVWIVTRIVLLVAGALGVGGGIVAAISAAIK